MKYIYKFRLLLSGVIIFISIFLFSDYQKFINELKETDANSWWRWTYWEHEYYILKDTYFLGVGFGTPYAKQEFTLTHASFGVSDASMENADAIYVTGQHNSLVNIFYRLGIVGGVVFLLFNAALFKYGLRLKRHLKLNKMTTQLSMVKWVELSFIFSLILVAFNVGLESPRFFLPYLFFTGLFLASIVKYLYLEKPLAA